MKVAWYFGWAEGVPVSKQIECREDEDPPMMLDGISRTNVYGDLPARTVTVQIHERMMDILEIGPDEIIEALMEYLGDVVSGERFNEYVKVSVQHESPNWRKDRENRLEERK